MGRFGELSGIQSWQPISSVPVHSDCWWGGCMLAPSSLYTILYQRALPPFFSKKKGMRGGGGGGKKKENKIDGERWRNWWSLIHTLPISPNSQLSSHHRPRPALGWRRIARKLECHRFPFHLQDSGSLNMPDCIMISRVLYISIQKKYKYSSTPCPTFRNDGVIRWHIHSKKAI